MTEIEEAQLCVIGTIAVGACWLLYHGIRHARSERNHRNLDDRVKVIEMWPNMDSKTKDHESRITYLEKEIDALKFNPFLKETLRKVK